MKRIILYLILSLLWVLIMSGCTSNKILKPEDVEIYKDQDIVVFLKTGDKVMFDKGQFTIIDDAGNQFIEGRGTRSDGEKSIFEGLISFSEIRSVNVNSISDSKTVAMLFVVTVSIVYIFTHLSIDFGG